MSGHVGLTPVPDDDDIEKFLLNINNDHAGLLLAEINNLFDALKETNESEQPRIFAYAKLLNHLAKEVEQPDLIAICAAAMWQIVTR